MDLRIAYIAVAESGVLGRPGLAEGGPVPPACPISLSF
jgi:hypothetical protein